MIKYSYGFPSCVHRYAKAFLSYQLSYSQLLFTLFPEVGSLPANPRVCPYLTTVYTEAEHSADRYIYIPTYTKTAIRERAKFGFKNHYE